MSEVPDTVDVALDALSSPSTDDVFEATRPFSAREIGSSAASRAIAGGNGGSQPAHSFGVHWFDPTGWTVADGDSWRSDLNIPAGIDWDTDGFADPNALPYFSCIIPTGLGGVYLSSFSAAYKSAVTGGYVGATVSANPTNNTAKAWTPCPFADNTISVRLIYTDSFNLDEEANDLDLAGLYNASGHDIIVSRVDWILTKVSEQPV